MKINTCWSTHIILFVLVISTSAFLKFNKSSIMWLLPSCLETSLSIWVLLVLRKLKWVLATPAKICTLSNLNKSSKYVSFINASTVRYRVNIIQIWPPTYLLFFPILVQHTIPHISAFDHNAEMWISSISTSVLFHLLIIYIVILQHSILASILFWNHFLFTMSIYLSCQLQEIMSLAISMFIITEAKLVSITKLADDESNWIVFEEKLTNKFLEKGLGWHLWGTAYKPLHLVKHKENFYWSSNTAFSHSLLDDDLEKLEDKLEEYEQKEVKMCTIIYEAISNSTFNMIKGKVTAQMQDSHCLLLIGVQV